MPIRRIAWKVRVSMVLLLSVAGAGAQSEAWTAFLDDWRKTSHTGVTLLVPKSAPLATHRAADDVFLQLAASRDLELEVLEGETLDRLRTALGWGKGSQWILLDPQGNTLLEGSALPSGEAVRAQLVKQGITPAWEALDQFLRLHPDSGDALQRRLLISYRMSIARFRALRAEGKGEGFGSSTTSRWPTFKPARIRDPAQAQGIAREVVDTLHRLNQVPDAWRVERGLFSFWLESMGSLDPDSLRSELDPFKESLLEAWQNNPQSGGWLVRSPKSFGMEELGSLWLSCHLNVSLHSGLSDLSRMQASPGHVWPSRELLTRICWLLIERQQPAELLVFLDGLTAERQQDAFSSESWPDWLELRQGIAAGRVMALAELNRWPEAISALQEYRRWSGSAWPARAAVFKQVYKPLPASEGKPEVGKLPPVPTEFLDLLDQPALELSVPVPRQGPLRFLVWDKPDWAVDWTALRSTAELAPWNSEELKHDLPTDRDSLRLTQAGLPVSGWAVFKDPAEIVCRGDSPPVPARLALALQSSAPARIQILDAFIKAHPDQLDARRDRYALVRRRMPLSALEMRLMEDAARAFIPLDFGPEAEWISDLSSWRVRAKAVVQELEPALRRWPASAPEMARQQGSLARVGLLVGFPAPASLRRGVCGRPAGLRLQVHLEDTPTCGAASVGRSGVPQATPVRADGRVVPGAHDRTPLQSSGQGLEASRGHRG